MTDVQEMIDWGDYERAISSADPGERMQVMAHVAQCLHEDYMAQLGYQVRAVLGVFDAVSWYCERIVADSAAPGKLHLLDEHGKVRCSARGSLKTPRGIWASASMFDYTACIRCEQAAAEAQDVIALAEMAEDRAWPVSDDFTKAVHELLAQRLTTSDWKAAWESACIDVISEYAGNMNWSIQPSLEWSHAAATVAFKALVHHQYWWHHVSFYTRRDLMHQPGKPPIRHIKLDAVEYVRTQCIEAHEKEIRGKAALASAPTRYLDGTLIPLRQRP